MNSGYFEKMNKEDWLYERLCMGCKREKRCHDNCEHCEEYEELLEEDEDD